MGLQNTSEIKNGLCIMHNNDIYKIIEFLHVKPGKGPAFIRTKLKSLTNGKVVDNTFPSSAKIDVVRVETRNYQYLYGDDEGFNFMNTEDYEQIYLESNAIENADLMKEGDICTIVFHAEEERPLTAELPNFLNLEVTYTEPGIKGDTATNSLKPATVETGAEIRVPLFINEGDLVRVDTRSRAYVERVKQ